MGGRCLLPRSPPLLSLDSARPLSRWKVAVARHLLAGPDTLQGADGVEVQVQVLNVPQVLEPCEAAELVV